MVFRFILVSALCFFSIFLNAQNELEFNKVINEKITGNGGFITKSVTVPKGKVWKITAASAGYNDSRKGLVHASGELAFTLNDVALFYKANGGNIDPPKPFPFWLPEGTYTMKLYFSSPSASFSIAGTISIIEFNVRK